MQHEAPLLLSFVALETLRIVGSAKRRAHKRLRLAARKQRRPVDPGQNANLDRQIANLIERTMIRTNSIHPEPDRGRSSRAEARSTCSASSPPQHLPLAGPSSARP